MCVCVCVCVVLLTKYFSKSHTPQRAWLYFYVGVSSPAWNRMDDLSALFFEDPEDDGIQPSDSEVCSDISQPLDYSPGEEGIRGALLSDSFVGEVRALYS